MNDAWITVKETASRLGVTTRTVRLWIEAGKLSGERIRGKYGPEWRVPAAQVEALVERQESRSVLLDTASAPGAQRPAAVLAALAAELTSLRQEIAEQRRLLASLDSALQQLPSALAAEAESTTILEGLVRQSSEVQRALQEESRLRRRETQELQGTLQALAALAQDNSERLERLTRQMDQASQPRGWWSRLRQALGSRS